MANDLKKHKAMEGSITLPNPGIKGIQIGQNKTKHQKYIDLKQAKLYLISTFYHGRKKKSNE